MSDYYTPSGKLFSFYGWQSGESPVECFDNKEWLRCLHGCMLCFYLQGHYFDCYLALADDGLLHELLHLASGVDICTHNSLDRIRECVVNLQSGIKHWEKI